MRAVRGPTYVIYVDVNYVCIYKDICNVNCMWKYMNCQCIFTCICLYIPFEGIIMGSLSMPRASLGLSVMINTLAPLALTCYIYLYVYVNLCIYDTYIHIWFHLCMICIQIYYCMYKYDYIYINIAQC
jgi:hypothetical protein